MSGFEDLTKARYVSLATYRKSGETVATPVWFVVQNGRGYVYTGRNAGKIKRLRSDPRAQVAPCSIRGKVKGAYRSAVARILDERAAEPIQAAFAKKYGIQWRFVMRRNRSGAGTAFIELTSA